MEENVSENSFTHRLIRRMKTRGVKQVDVVGAIGASPPTVSAWYRGRAQPRTENINKLSNFLQTTSEWLLDGTGEEHKDRENQTSVKDANPVARRLRARMHDLNIASVDLVHTTSATKGAVSKWVRGGAIPSQPFIAKLAVILETTPNWILYGEDAHADNEILTADERKYLIGMRKRTLNKEIDADKVIITLNVKKNTYRVEGIVLEN